MKFIRYFLFSLLVSSGSFAQSIVEKTIPVQPGSEIQFVFERPELITVKSWSENDIKIVATVNINKGQNDDAFKINVESSDSKTYIASEIEDYKNLPQKILIKKDGQEYFFNTSDRNSPEIKEFENEHGSKGYSYMVHGVIVEVSLEVWVPQNISIDIYSKFGLVELIELENSLKAHSKFGGIDLTTNGKLPIKAGTKFGEKYTNLTSQVSSIQVGSSPGKWDWVQLGTENKYNRELKSEFGNIYIRKQ